MKKLIFITILTFLLPKIASGGGIQVGPAKLDLQINSSDIIKTELTIANPSPDVQIFQIYPDDFRDMIKAEPASFTLEAGEIKKIKLSITPPNPLISQKRSTNISVVSKPLAETGFSANTGVKIPLVITITPTPLKNNNPYFWLYYFAPIAALYLIVRLYAVWRRRKTKIELNKS